MDLTDVYQLVQPSIIAFTPKYVPKGMPEDFPPIFGTGFIIADGLIATNDHVVQAFANVPRPKGTPLGDWGVIAWLFHFLPKEGMAQIPLHVVGVLRVTIEVKGHYYGSKRPDLAFVHVKATGLPALRIAEAPHLEPGVQVATAGFTMGTDALRAPGWIHQLTPTLQTGIISAVLPFPCESPHAVMLNIMTRGGASGSPVFSVDEPEAVGVLYGGLIDHHTLPGTKSHYRVPTNFSYFVPAHYLKKTLEGIDKIPDLKLEPATPSLEHILATYERKVHAPENRTRQPTHEVVEIVAEPKINVVADVVRIDPTKKS
ncbi:MAG TPA: hypothetical protein DCZ05_13915 [Deltaproteobacteria bacterium]|nr:hypothetical protein [Deltaproteobacteria bacterium]